MKTLTLLRHAKSSWSDPARGDFERPLNTRGERNAVRIGREMRALGLAFDAIAASPARRVVETLAGAAEGYGAALTPGFDQRLYLAAPATLLAVIREAGGGGDRLLVVGHNPGLHMLALMLTGDNALADKYPTGALAEIALAIDHWRDIGEGGGRLLRFIRPRDLDPAIDPDDD